MNLWNAVHIPVRAWRFRYKGEPECVAHLLQQDLRGKTCLDIGAHKGAFTYWLCRQVGATGRVIGFEPQPELHSYLERCWRHFRHEGLRFEPLALSAQAGTMTLVRDFEGAGSAGLHSHVPSTAQTLQVAVTTIDDYVRAKELERISFIKCDVEGHEESVFRGAEQTLLRDQPQLLFEGHDIVVRDRALFNYLESLGYVGFFFAFRRLHAMKHWHDLIGLDNPLMTNYVFVPRHQAQRVPVASAAQRKAMLRHAGPRRQQTPELAPPQDALRIEASRVA